MIILPALLRSRVFSAEAPARPAVYNLLFTRVEWMRCTRNFHSVQGVPFPSSQTTVSLVFTVDRLKTVCAFVLEDNFGNLDECPLYAASILIHYLKQNILTSLVVVNLFTLFLFRRLPKGLYIKTDHLHIFPAL